jgi:hypothetical protein
MLLFGLPLFSFFDACGLLMESLSSCVFLSQLLNLQYKSTSVFSLISIVSSSPEILSSAYSSLLEWLSPVFFI